MDTKKIGEFLKVLRKERGHRKGQVREIFHRESLKVL